jgi:hypothetical protein
MAGGRHENTMAIVSEETTAGPITTALGMYLQAIEAVHRKRTIAFCYCAVGSSLGIVEATDEYHFPVFVMATPTDAGTLADQLNYERLGLSRQQAEKIIGQSWARFPRMAERASPVVIDCVGNSEGTHLARPALGQLATAALLAATCARSADGHGHFARTDHATSHWRF